MMDRPPCWQDGKKQNPCALAHCERVVHGHTDLRADWLGMIIAAAILEALKGRLYD